MTRKELKTVESILGYRPNEAMQVLLLEQVKAGKSMLEAISYYTMPDFGIVGDDGRFEFHGQRITIDEWRKINPLAEFGKIALVKKREISNNE